MTTSESIAALAAALAKAQAVMGGAKKDTANPFFKSKYADLASCWEAARSALPAQGLCIIQTTRQSDKDEVVVITRLAHESGEWIEGELALPVSKADAQGYGSALTYARRYGLCAVVGIAPEDDDGNAAAAAKPLPRPIPANVEGIDIYNALPDEARAVVDETAAECISLVRTGDLSAAVSVARKMCATHEDELALASRLPSDARNKMKAEKQRKSQPNLAEQA
jgi:hypothetical protein